MRIDFDSTWKDTTDVYFTALLELFEPQMLPRVGDHEPVSFLDQEMQELAQVLVAGSVPPIYTKGDIAAYSRGGGLVRAHGPWDTFPTERRRRDGDRKCAIL